METMIGKTMYTNKIKNPELIWVGDLINQLIYYISNDMLVMFEVL